jgi:hypothetical protein
VDGGDQSQYVQAGRIVEPFLWPKGNSVGLRGVSPEIDHIAAPAVAMTLVGEVVLGYTPSDAPRRRTRDPLRH